MFGSTTGIRASQLIAQLQALIAKHGDCEVITCGGDYPDGCTGARYNATERAYYPAKTIVVD